MRTCSIFTTASKLFFQLTTYPEDSLLGATFLWYANKDLPCLSLKELAAVLQVEYHTRMGRSKALALLALEKLRASWWCGRCYNSSLWSLGSGRIIIAWNYTKIAKAKKCGKECDQGAVVYLLWSLKRKARETGLQRSQFLNSLVYQAKKLRIYSLSMRSL